MWEADCKEACKHIMLPLWRNNGSRTGEFKMFLCVSAKQDVLIGMSNLLHKVCLICCKKWFSWSLLCNLEIAGI